MHRPPCRPHGSLYWRPRAVGPTCTASSTEQGIKDIHIRTEAPNAIWFDATIDRIADALGLLGDADAKDVRRAKAVGVVAQPQTTLHLFDQAAGETEDETPASDCANKRRPVGWQVRQPFNGVLVWKSPHRHYYLVDHTGTQHAILP